MDDLYMLSDLRKIDRWMNKVEMPLCFESYVCWRMCDDARITKQQLRHAFDEMDRGMLETDYADNWEDFWCLLNESIAAYDSGCATNLMDSYVENLEKTIECGRLQPTVDSINLVQESQSYRHFILNCVFEEDANDNTF